MADESCDKLEIERALLGALCEGSVPPEDRDDALQRLAGYNWRGTDHRVIYEALRRSRQPASPSLHEFMVAEITRLGFPDIDVAPFFKSRGRSTAAIRKLVENLLAAHSDTSESK